MFLNNKFIVEYQRFDKFLGFVSKVIVKLDSPAKFHPLYLLSRIIEQIQNRSFKSMDLKIILAESKILKINRFFIKL